MQRAIGGRFENFLLLFGDDTTCRLIDSLAIILQEDLIIKSSFLNTYVYDCHVNHIYIYIYMFTARTMTM